MKPMETRKVHVEIDLSAPVTPTTPCPTTRLAGAPPLRPHDLTPPTSPDIQSFLVFMQ